MTIYYVYAYLRKDGSPYYIGKGSGKRAWVKGSNDAISAPTDKSRIIILESNLTEVGSLAIERRLIKWYGRKDLGTGILRNQSDGGDGASNCKRSESTKQKLSKALKGRSVDWCLVQVVDPTGRRYPSIKEAASTAGLTTEGIRYRCKVRKDGWHFGS